VGGYAPHAQNHGRARGHWPADDTRVRAAALEQEFPRTEVRGTDSKTKPSGLAEAAKVVCEERNDSRADDRTRRTRNARSVFILARQALALLAELSERDQRVLDPQRVFARGCEARRFSPRWSPRDRSASTACR